MLNVSMSLSTVTSTVGSLNIDLMEEEMYQKQNLFQLSQYSKHDLQFKLSDSNSFKIIDGAETVYSSEEGWSDIELTFFDFMKDNLKVDSME